MGMEAEALVAASGFNNHTKAQLDHWGVDATQRSPRRPQPARQPGHERRRHEFKRRRQAGRHALWLPDALNDSLAALCHEQTLPARGGSPEARAALQAPCSSALAVPGSRLPRPSPALAPQRCAHRRHARRRAQQAHPGAMRLAPPRLLLSAAHIVAMAAAARVALALLDSQTNPNPIGEKNLSTPTPDPGRTGHHSISHHSNWSGGSCRGRRKDDADPAPARLELLVGFVNRGDP